MAAADEATLHFSQQDQTTEFDMMTKQVVWLPDQNTAGVYPNGQIIFDLASISNSGKYFDTNQSTLVIPLVLNVNVPVSPTSATNPADVFIASLKNGNHHLINSMSVELTNNQIVNLTNFSNLDINYRLLTSQSLEDLQNFGYSINFVKDTTESIVYQPTAAAQGIGECNNTMVPTQFSITGNGWGDTIFQYNEGRFKRMVKTSYDPTAFSTASAAQRPFSSAANATLTGKDYAVVTSSAGKTTNVTYYILATIPLRILHPVFNKLPLMKGAYFRLIINTNTSCSTSITMNANTYTGFTSTSLNNVLPFQISPIVVGTATAVTTQNITAAAQTTINITLLAANAAIAPGQYVTGTGVAANTFVVSISGTALVLSVAPTLAASATLTFNTYPTSLNLGNASVSTTITASLGIGKSITPSTFQHPTFTSCRLYATLYEMTPTYQEKYMEMFPTKRVVYNDILSFQYFNVAKNGSVSQILTNGVSRARYLIVIPQISASTHGSSAIATDTTSISAGTSLGSPMNSPFSSSPGTTAPFSAISNFNILVSGTALYQSNLAYGFEHFLQEIRGCNSLNGGLQMGLSSGVLSQQEWEAGYHYAFVDLSRKANQANDDISRSIQVIFNNASNVTMDYYFIIAYEREITVSTQTGSLVI